MYVVGRLTHAVLNRVAGFSHTYHVLIYSCSCHLLSPVSPRMGSGGPIGISLHTLIARALAVRDNVALRTLVTSPRYVEPSMTLNSSGHKQVMSGELSK